MINDIYTIFGWRKTIIKNIIIFLLCEPLLTASLALSAPIVGRVDDFEDGTLQGWGGGGGNNPDYNNIPSGGPTGAGDNFLQIKRPTASNPFPFHLGTKNTTTWTGDYLTAGIKAIAMDVNAISVTSVSGNLSLRIVLFGPGGAFSSKDATTVITSGGWQYVEFDLTRSGLVRVFGSGGSYIDPGAGIDNLTDTLGDVGTLLIRHDSNANPTPIGSHPEHILATVGIDNISALLGPAPSYDVTWVFDNNSIQSYVLDSFEPNDAALGEIDADDPTLLLYLGERCQVTVLDDANHPLEVLAKGASAGLDTVLLSMKPAVTGTFESDPNVAWEDNGIGTAAFTLAEGLYNAMIVPNKRPGYRCGIHVVNMRGDFDICTAAIASDLNGDCNVDFHDLALFALDWLDSNVVP
jgi:hypothetical protein